MLTREEDVEINALHKRGWKIADIARHIGRGLSTIRCYLKRHHGPWSTRTQHPDPFEVFLAYVTARLLDSPHVWVRRLCDELGYSMSYQTLHRKIRELKLRPICQACLTATGSPNAVIVTLPVKGHDGIGSIFPTHPQRGDGGDGVSVRRNAGVLRPVARHPRTRDDPISCRRRTRPDLPRSPRDQPGLAVRPDGHGLPPRLRPDHRQLRQYRTFEISTLCQSERVYHQLRYHQLRYHPPGPTPTSSDANPRSRGTLFDERERRLAKLRNHTDEGESLTRTPGYMTLVAISSEEICVDITGNK